MKVGMLVTNESEKDDSMRARPMYLVQEAYDGTLYFYTPKSDAKVYEIEKDRDVCMTFASPEHSTYVSLTGKAILSEDKNLIDRYWSPTVEAWFEGGRDNPEIAMLEVKIKQGEHWDSTENKLVQIFEKVKSNVMDSKTPDVGENEKFGSQ
jgi:general stress protein 26